MQTASNSITKRLFDTSWYLKNHPKLPRGADALEHYRQHGAAEGRSPTPLLDTAWYRAEYGELGMTPLDHYVEVGASAGCFPNPWFDSAWYLEANPDVAAAGANPLDHYLFAGAREGRDPHPLFSSSWYVSQNPGAAHVNPLEHFLRWGEKRGLSPHPLFDPEWYAAQYPESGKAGTTPLQHYLSDKDEIRRDPHPLFSATWYLTCNGEVRDSRVNALEHYLRFGAAKGLDPHPLFSSRWYLAQNPDVAESGVIPLVHYILKGARECRSPNPLFDAKFYLAQQRNPEVAAGAPLEHYITVGWRRGLKPHSTFAPAFYLRENPDVKQSGVEPLTHFLTVGRSSGERHGAPAEVIRGAASEAPRAVTSDGAELRTAVTVAIPIYRGKSFLQQSLASVRDQTYRAIEVVMSLDGPDPECEEICQRFLSDPRFRLQIQPHRLGWMPHTSMLMSQVQTEFWHLQEQDDIIEPDFLEKLLEQALAFPEAAAVFSDVHTFGSMDVHMEMSSVLGSPLTRQMKLIYEHFPGVAPLGLVRTEALRLCGGLQPNEFENFAADTAFMSGLARWGELRRLPVELYRKRVHDTSTHATWWEWDMERRFKAWQAHCGDMLQQALLIDGSPQDRRLLWLAIIERLVSPRTASFFLHIDELTTADRMEMLEGFLERARNSSIDIPGALAASWEQIHSWTKSFYWVP